MTLPPGAPPVGSQITRDYQYEFRGMVIGSGTPFVTTKVTGVLDMADLIQYHSKAQSKHGIFYGYEVLDARKIDFDVSIVADSGLIPTAHMKPGDIVEQMLDAFSNCFSTTSVFANTLTIPLAQNAIDDMFIVKRPNKAPRFYYGHCVKRQFPSTGDVATGLAQGSVEILCGDPLCYSLSQKSVSYATGASNAHAINPVVCHNDGNFPGQQATITINGPGGVTGNSGPWVITNYNAPNNPLTGSPPAIRLDMLLGPADSITIDLKAKTITGIIGGVSYDNLYQFRRSDSDWWALQPGDNSIMIVRPTTDTIQMTATINWRDAWSNA